MIRSFNTLQQNFTNLQRKQEMVSSNLANINTPGYQAQRSVQSTEAERQMFNRLGGPNRDQEANIGGFTFSNYIDEVYVNQEPGTLKQDETNPTQYIELSNVNTADEMVELMKISREFESNQRALQATDETLRRATNEIGKV
ncbi:MAG TPA: flagellar basal body protein [Candidatus Jeotgalibaca merdavium]|uniref:Flagellar basal body protein n=1 Tax=Candidatus Jeotgalibaca merdavium TaxID=2838627 RepID=A0A9D2KW35_9LACT|nr:flagellar basal body protein [Candidatus Jeotgalibaca merdavium]